MPGPSPPKDTAAMLWTLFSWLLPCWNVVAAGLLLRYVAYRSQEQRDREAAQWGASGETSPSARMVAWVLAGTSALTLVALLVTRDPVLMTLPWAQFIANSIADRMIGSDGTKARALRAASARARSAAH